MLILLRLGGVPLMGGPFGPSLSRSRGDSSGEGRAAHGPLHPAVNRSLETLMALLFVFLLWSWFCHLVACIAFFCLWRWYLVWSLSPSSPDPCLVFVCVPFFLLSGWFRRRRVFSSLLFLSGAGETQTPFGGLGFPLCFFDLDAIAHSDPYSELRTYTMATPRTCLFFFFSFSSSSPLVFRFGCFSVLSWWCWVVPGGGSLYAL